MIVPLAVGGASPVAGAENVPSCDGDSVVLVHDFADVGASASPLAADLTAAGRCVHVVEHGRANGLVALLGPLGPGGLGPLEQSAASLAKDLAQVAASSPTGRIDVVAHGAGSLAVTRALQTQLDPALVDTLVAPGALWDGTNLLGLGDLEQLSRDAGTYDAVLGLERFVLDPLCASCREVVAGSDFLRDLHAAGLVPPGPRVVTILSTSDTLVQPATSGELAGADNRWVQDVAPGRVVLHLGMLRDVVVRQMVADALLSSD